MTETASDPRALLLTGGSGMRVELNANGSLRRFDCNGVCLTLFVGNEVEGGPANVYLRRLAPTSSEPAGAADPALVGEPATSANPAATGWTPLLGPLSPTRFHLDRLSGTLRGTGSWMGIDYSIALVLAQTASAWFWHVRLENSNSTPQQVDLTYAQDLALAPYGSVRLNEYYVSQYVDHSPLSHATHGSMIASRQNLAADGCHPWTLVGSLRTGRSFATDALQFHGLASRSGATPAGLVADLPGRRLQHEHSMAVIRDAPLQLDPGKNVAAGFFGSFHADHPEATTAADANRLSGILALPEATSPAIEIRSGVGSGRAAALGGAAALAGASLFSSAPLLEALDLDRAALQSLFGSQWRHEELDESGSLLSFFHGADRHVVLRAKELRVQRPHGHVLRTGRHTTPDESALTSTVWMSGVFHSMVTQGHVSINRFLSTVHSYLGLFRSHGERVFAQIDGAWRLLNVPSAFEMSPDACVWIYRHPGGVIRLCSTARGDPHELTLSIEVVSGEPIRFLISQHVAINGDDGSVRGAVRWRREGDELVVVPAPGSELAQRFPNGSMRVAPTSATRLDRVGGDELLFADGCSRDEPFLCVVTAPTRIAGLSIRGDLIAAESQRPLRVAQAGDLIPGLKIRAAPTSALAAHAARIADVAPWYAHNAFVHYLSPRGLEQYSGGGWGTRDVCQGPVEMLFALGRVEPVRDLLIRVMSAQNADGDWPQWFMFFERERNIRPGDSHGDVVFWPLLVLAQYLLASGDAGVLDEPVPYFDPRGTDAAERGTLWQHVERALAVIESRVIPGTALPAYGHGDWNDSLQPADPVLRERLCSAWTATLHFQTLKTLDRALRLIGHSQEASRLERWAREVERDFQRLLIVDGVLAGYAHFEDGGRVRYILHPRDETTGIRYSSLAMIHAILEDMLTPDQVREHLRLIQDHLSAPDGARLFDRPMQYHGGPERIFQRAESATFFGREIGLMYTHAHLRYAQALAHVGEADRFFRALCQANPIEIRSIIPSATLRQANCYYSSSDAAFADRYHAAYEYERVARGTVAFDGGWRVYSSGAGIALGLIVRRFLGLSVESDALHIDPVIPAALDGLNVETTLLGHTLEAQYRVGSSGCGVNTVVLNGQTLPFTRGANPHRRGAALVDRAQVQRLLAAGRNVLRIDLG